MSVSSTSGSKVTVSGLGSGLDIADIVDKFVAIETIPQNKLKTSLAQHQAKVSTYQTLNSAFTALKTASQDLALSNNWQAKTSTSTSTNVGVTTTASAANGTFTFSVQNLAKADARVSSGSVSSLNQVIDSSTGTTFQQQIDKINTGTGNYTASAVQISPGVYKMQLQAKETGLANKITDNVNGFAGTLGSFVSTQDPLDAAIKVGSGTNAYTITSSTNAMKDVLPGVTLNLNKADPALDVTVGVTGDASGMADKVGAMMTAVNDALNLINKNSKYDAASKKGGVFQGDAMTRRLVDQLHNAVSEITGGNVKLASDVGITSNADGSFTFDKTKFISKYQTDPEGVAGLFVSGGTTGTTNPSKPGIAERIQSVTKQATDSVSGFITTQIAGENKTITDLNKNIASWDDRLVKKRETLTRMYTQLDLAMSKYSNMSSWLGGQISGLASNS